MTRESADCPTPEKRTFRSKAQAKRHNVQRQQVGCPRFWPYECRCGMWHLTNQNYAEQKRIAQDIADYYAGKKLPR